jgi:hypothetical protein
VFVLAGALLDELGAYPPSSRSPESKLALPGLLPSIFMSLAMISVV